MADLAAFAEEGFDPKAWINAAVSARGQDEPLERFLAELEMRLQLGGEEVEAALSACCSAALRRVPFAQQEVARLRGDVGALQASAEGLLTSVAADAEAAGAAAAPLAALHTARTNMEAGCATLREAAELSGAFRRVDEVFAAGDLPRVAEMLKSMSKSLALVGGVPEFREGRSRLAALEDRLQRRVEGRLADALQANNGVEVASLAALLLAVGRYQSLEAAYVSSRLPLVAAVWDEAAALFSSAAAGPAAAAAAAPPPAGAGARGGAGGLGGGWLLLLYNNLLGLLEADSAWLAACLPGQRRQLLLALTAAALGKVNRPVQEKLAALRSTAVLAGLLGDVLVAARRLRELLAAAGAAEAADAARLLKLLLGPLEEQVSRYSALEEPSVAAELTAALPVGAAATADAAAAGAAAAAADELEPDAAQRLDAASAAALPALAAAVDRCAALTGGTELPALLAALDRQAAGYLQRLQAAAGIINARYRDQPASSTPSADPTAVLQLVLLARHVSSRLGSLEAHLRSTVATSIPRAQQLAAAGLPPAGLAGAAGAQQQHAHQQHHAAAGIPPAAAAAAAELLPLRLVAFPEKLAPLAKLQRAAQGSRYMSLPSANAAGGALCESVSSSAYDALLAPVAAALEPLPALPEWTAAAPGGVAPGAGAVVPTFSAYPLQAITAAGEYLMALPQQLEVFMGDEQQQQGGEAAAAAEEDGDELAAEWLDRVVRGAGLAYADALLRIRRLSPAGAAQLAADAEYFANVMSALAVAPPPALITAQLFAAAPADVWASTAAGAAAEGSADAKVLKAIAAMRGIEWSEQDAAAAVAAAAAAAAPAADGGAGQEAPPPPLADDQLL